LGVQAIITFILNVLCFPSDETQECGGEWE